MADSQPISWPDLAIGLYDRLTGRQAEISYEFENLHVQIACNIRLHESSGNYN